MAYYPRGVGGHHTDTRILSEVPRGIRFQALLAAFLVKLPAAYRRLLLKFAQVLRGWACPSAPTDPGGPRPSDPGEDG